MEEVFQILNLVQPLPTSLRDHLVNILRRKTLKKKEFLLTAGQVCRNIYFIRKGILRCFYLKDGKEVCSWFMKEGDVVISIESFYTQTASYEYLQALEETETWYISYQELQLIYRQFPCFNTTGRLITQQYHQHWAWQLFAIRMQTAEERYKWLVEHHPQILMRVPGKYIATYLDIAEVTLSKIRARM